MGNRGILHDENRALVRTSRNRAWLICRLEFGGRRRVVMSPGTYTELFFLDEAVALAAGHRPCGECRRSRYRAYRAALDVPVGGAPDLDRMLNESRRAARVVAPIASLPDGAFVTVGDADYRLVWRGNLHRWTAEGYEDPIPLADREATVVTPALSIDALRGGYGAEVHASARSGPSLR